MVTKNFTVNVCNARHELDLLKAIITDNNYTEVYIKDSKADMMWQHAASQDYSKHQLLCGCVIQTTCK